ncbi:MAG: PqiC family protein [Kiritimatiellae bacterium]|jgi:uncharacterized lipoprotein YmbA|nr:PqiC family protein [Kiritimatiellia bacterium]
MKNIYNRIILPVIVASICGCAHSPTPRLYLLRSDYPSIATNATNTQQKPLVIMRPLQMAEYLNRPQIVIRKGEREVANAEFDRWAEPLETQAATYLTDTLTTQLNEFNIKPFPWRGNTTPLYEIKISILQLDGIPGDSVQMRADWQILKAGKIQSLISEERSDLQVKCTEQGVPGIVAATEQLFGNLSQTIASSLKKHHALGK